MECTYTLLAPSQFTLQLYIYNIFSLQVLWQWLGMQSRLSDLNGGQQQEAMFLLTHWT